MRSVDLWLQQSDEFILQALSTTPDVEPPHTVMAVSIVLVFILTLILGCGDVSLNCGLRLDTSFLEVCTGSSVPSRHRVQR